MLYYCLCFPFFSGKKTWLICSYKSLLHHCQKHTEETERASQKSISSACWPILACSAYKSGSADPFFGGCGEHFRCILKQLGVGSRTIGYLKTSVRCCMAERYFEKFWQHGKPVPRSCHADQSS